MAMFGIIGRIVRNRRGGTAASFALLLPVLLSGMGIAIDYSHYHLVHTRLQAAVDAAALSAITDLSVGEGEIVDKAVDTVEINLPSDYGDATRPADVIVGAYDAAGVFVPGGGTGTNAVRVTAIRSPARGNAAPRIFSVFISGTALTISATATAARPSNVFYEPPEVSKLDSAAWDFNELYAYCYNSASGAKGPSKLISNNMRNGITPALFPANADAAQNIQEPNTEDWPECSGAGESISFKLRNFIQANQNRHTLWTTQVNIYETDTVLTDGVESSPLYGPGQLVDRMLCDTRELCDPTQPGSLITGQDGAAKTPNLETRPCSPGKFMYMGFEDRPPSNGGSDRDYNDIRIRLRCPRNGELGDNAPRLVR